MNESVKNNYDKMPEYLESMYNILRNIHKKSVYQKDKKLNLIARAIFNYLHFMSKKYEVKLNSITESAKINMIPIFEYISSNNIELYDFSKIEVDDVDINKNEDLERFILTHIYYITQSGSI